MPSRRRVRRASRNLSSSPADRRGRSRIISTIPMSSRARCKREARKRKSPRSSRGCPSPGKSPTRASSIRSVLVMPFGARGRWSVTSRSRFCWQTSRYGILDVAKDAGELVAARGVVEKPDPAKAPSRLCIIGRYILQPEVFDALGQIGKGAGGEIQLTDALARLIAAKQPFYGLRFAGRRFDCGDKVGFLEANLAFALARPELGAAVKDIIKHYV